MTLRYSKNQLLKIALLFTMLLTNKSILYSQTTSDSLKCFTYSEARKIITDLRQLPIKDSIINRFDSIVKIDSVIIQTHEATIVKHQESIRDKSLQIGKLKTNRKLFVIFGGILGLCTQFIF